MSEPLPRRLGGHLRRHSIAYAVLALAVSVSPAPSMAVDLVTTADIANGAVTQPKLAVDSVVGGKVTNGSLTGVDIQDGTVGTADLKSSARGAKVYRYNVGSWDFSTPATYYLGLDIPDVDDAATVANSTWSVTMQYANPGNPNFNANYVVPGYGYNRTTFYDLLVTDQGNLYIERIGPAEVGVVYQNIRVYRTVATSMYTYASARSDKRLPR